MRGRLHMLVLLLFPPHSISSGAPRVYFHTAVGHITPPLNCISIWQAPPPSSPTHYITLPVILTRLKTSTLISHECLIYQPLRRGALSNNDYSHHLSCVQLDIHVRTLTPRVDCNCMSLDWKPFNKGGKKKKCLAELK